MPPLQDLMEGNIVVPPNLYNALTSPKTAVLQELVGNTVRFPQRLMQTFAENPVGLGLRRSDYTDIPEERYNQDSPIRRALAGTEPINPSVGMATDVAWNMVGVPTFRANPATLGSGAGVPRLHANYGVRPPVAGIRAANENIGPEGPSAIDMARREGYGSGQFSSMGQGEGFLIQLIRALQQERGENPIGIIK